MQPSGPITVSTTATSEEVHIRLWRGDTWLYGTYGVDSTQKDKPTQHCMYLTRTY